MTKQEVLRILYNKLQEEDKKPKELERSKIYSSGKIQALLETISLVENIKED